MVEVDPERFEAMVSEALDGLPAELGERMSNVAITVEHNEGPAGLLGLYRGIPLTRARWPTPVCCPTGSRSTAVSFARSAAATKRSSSRFAGRWSTRSVTTSVSTTRDCANSEGECRPTSDSAADGERLEIMAGPIPG